MNIAGFLIESNFSLDFGGQVPPGYYIASVVPKGYNVQAFFEERDPSMLTLAGPKAQKSKARRTRALHARGGRR